MTGLSVNLKKVASCIYKQAGTGSLGKRLRAYLSEGNLLGLVSQKIDPRDYADAHRFRKDYQCVNLLRKLQASLPGVDREAVAISAFWQSEFQCGSTNRRFRRYTEQGDLTLSEARALSVLEESRKWLKKVLGPLPEDLVGRFGPGATFELRGPVTTIPDKLEQRATITPGARDLLPLAYRSLLLGPSGRQYDPQTVPGNRFQTVPKDALKDRGICIEPGVNLWFQLGVGAALRRRLRTHAGIDLERAQPIHRQWAQQASKDGLRATIDLSNASDTVALELVRWLMPADWFCLLDSLRSPTTLIGGKAEPLRKFSSMGNGYTFELETLIFCSLCYAVGCGTSGVDYLVFGDDIIVDTERAADVLSVLRFCGFTPNERKTFVSGWFRESCGGDYFKGLDVSPHYQKVDPSHPAEWIALANGLRRRSSFNGVGFQWQPNYAAWLAALEALPVQIRRLRGPEELGDLVIHDHQFDIDRSKGYGRVRVLKPEFDRLPLSHWPSDVVIAYAVYSSSSSEASLYARFTPRWPFIETPQRSRGLVPRGPPKGYKISYVAYG